MIRKSKELLIGWKEIAVYLEISERTAIRYYKERGLPVKKDCIGHPVIKKIEIDKWRVA
ncbi:MAG: hypothetical protein WC905_04625 [Patescibacteria group bacterium]|jgi:hypothetical protein